MDNQDITTLSDSNAPTGPIPSRITLHGLEGELQRFIQNEEKGYHSKKIELTDSLWSHSIRVAALAEKIGLQEEADLTACRLAGLFHDAGKFVDGAYHSGTDKEEDGSVRVLYEITKGKGILPEIVEQVAKAILEMYSQSHELSLLGKILFDADNLDKIGLPGVCNFMIKAGLRGRGLNRALLYRVGRELTYARYAPQRMMTETAKKLAEEKAPETINFYHNMLESLRNDCLYDFYVCEVEYNGMTLDIVETPYCICGGSLERLICEAPDLKCRKIHVVHRCSLCESVSEYQFCRPLLSSS